MRIVVQVCNSYALEEFVYTADSAENQEETRDIRLPSDRFQLVSDQVISLNISSRGITLNENSSNVFFLITNKSSTYNGTLAEDTSLTLITQHREKLRMFVYIGEETGMCFYQTERSRVISLGSSLDQSISCVDNSCLSGTHLLIRRSADGGRINIKGREGIYLNERYVDHMETAALSCGDVISAGGIRILWLDEYIGIEKLYSDKPCIVRLKQADDIRVPASADAENALKGFTPSPRNIIIPDDSEIELDAPPPKTIIGSRPVYITVGPALTMAIPMSLGCGLYIYSASHSDITHSSMYMYTGLITALSSAFLGALWALLNLKHEKKQAVINETVRVKRYRSYIENAERRIIDKYKYNANALMRNSPSLREIFANRDMIQVWNRRETDVSLYTYRLGTGKLPFDVKLKVPAEKFMITEDELVKLPGVLKRKYREMRDVPICTDIADEPMQGFIGSGAELEQLFINIALQIASTTGPELIRMIFIFPNRIIPKITVRLMRWLPHAQGEDEHYVCTDRERADEMLCGLDALLKQPGMRKYRWVILTDDIRAIPSSLVEEPGISVLIFSNEYALLPGSCTKVIQNDRSYRGMFDISGREARREICFDSICAADAKRYVQSLAGIKLISGTAHNPVPSKVTLFRLFNTGLITSDLILDNWRRNNTLNSLRAPVGMASDNRIVFLDLHEKGHGPHGLIAGMTGSGKSELLQTLIISLSVRYPPDELGFFLIDYKGGGMAGMFEGLPHLMGSISNLSGNTIRRAMVSIRSENERRQRMFIEAGVNCVRDYERLYINGQVKKPMPHILIIVDEFAELKREEPDFLRELISVAQVGRSLGVHLILATQKPAGTVDDNIFSNSRFRICLRVQDRQDSNDMLRRPDAAYITDPGRAYLQVGSDEIFEEFQAGYTMEPYDDMPKAEPVYLLDEYGRRTGVYGNGSPNEGNAAKETQFGKVTMQLSACAGTDKYKVLQRLWLPPLEQNITLDGLNMINSRGKYDVVIGRYDEPGAQKQDYYHHDLITSGHTVICGSTLSGKSTFLQTFIYSHISAETPDMINIYIIDYSNGMLSCFKDSKAVGEYICEESEKKLNNLFCMLKEIMKTRRSGWEGVSFAQRIEEDDFSSPAILLVIDNYGGFREKTSLMYDKEMLELIKFGEAYGIFVLLTGASIGNGDIPARQFEYFRTGICLNMYDKYQYSECLREIRLPILPDDINGRGVARINGSILEFQTAVCCEGNDNERIRYIKRKITQFNESCECKAAMRVPYIPDEPFVADLDAVLPANLSWNEGLPLGYEAISGKPYIVKQNAQSCIVIAGREGSGKSNACMVITHYAGCADIKVRYASNIAEICSLAKDEPDSLIICDGMIRAIDDFYKKYEKQTEDEFIDLIKMKGCIRMVFTVDTREHSIVAGRRIYEEIKERCLGICLGGGLDRQNVFDYSYLPYSEQCPVKPAGTGTVLKRRRQAYFGDIVIPNAEAVA